MASKPPKVNSLPGQRRTSQYRLLPCAVPIKEWLTLTVRMTEKSLEVLLNGSLLVFYAGYYRPMLTWNPKPAPYTQGR